MKLIKYKFLSCEINHGTEEDPDIEQIFLDKEIQCSDANFNTNYAIAEKEAYGEITVEDIGDAEPTPQEDTDAMLVDHEYRLTLLELGLTDL